MSNNLVEQLRVATEETERLREDHEKTVSKFMQLKAVMKTEAEQLRARIEELEKDRPEGIFWKDAVNKFAEKFMGACPIVNFIQENYPKGIRIVQDKEGVK